jgi:hypothetical protein
MSLSPLAPARLWPFSRLLITALLLLQSSVLLAEQVSVRHPEGTTHGFLVLRNEQGKELAEGELTQVVKGHRLIANLVFHFKDGSIDDETTVYSQRGVFRLLSDRHVQKGPSFPHPMDVSIDASTGQVTVLSDDGGKEKIGKDHLDLPPDLANGLIITLLKNIRPDTPQTKVSFVAAASKPQLVTLSIQPQGKETFRVAGARHKATRYDIKTEIGGIKGVIAPLVGKQPKDIYIWILSGKAPTFVRMEGQLYQGGPVWTVQLASPVWPKAQGSEHHGAESVGK